MANFTEVALTGSYTDAQGNPLQGQLTFSLSQVISNPGLQTVIPSPQIVDIIDGDIAVTLYANNDPTTVPQGSWYQVTEIIYNDSAHGSQGQGLPRDYSIMIPYQDNEGNPLSEIDISQLQPGTPMGFFPGAQGMGQVNLTSGSYNWTTFLDMPEVLQWLQFTSGLTPGNAQTALIQRMIDSACYRAQEIANRPLCPTTFYNRYDGWAGEYIQLDFSPIINLVSCNEWQSTGGFQSLPESTPENPVEGIQIDYDTGRIMRTFSGYSWPRPFFPGSRNIEVVWTAGFNPVPPTVWEAAVDLVAYWWRNTQQASRSYPGPGTSYGGPDTGGTGDLWPGIPDRISDVFESYRLPVIG